MEGGGVCLFFSLSFPGSSLEHKENDSNVQGIHVSKLCLPLIQTSVEEMIASTAYLELFLRSISEPALLRTFLRFLLLHRHDAHTILDTLVARIGSNSRVWPLALYWLMWVTHFSVTFVFRGCFCSLVFVRSLQK